MRTSAISTAIGMIIGLTLAGHAGASSPVNTDFSIAGLGLQQGVAVSWSASNAQLQSRTNLLTGGWITMSNSTSPYFEAPGLPMNFFRLDFGAVASTPPTANGDAYSVTHDQVLSVPPAGVLDNDVDNNDLPMSATLESSPANGSLSFNADGSFDYTPNPGYVGMDSFTYVASDELGGVSDPATVQITVVNNPPVAVADSYGVQEDTTLYVAAPGVLANDTDADGDTLTAILASGPANGAVTLNADGSFSYAPDNGYVGPDAFTYYDNDGIANGNTVSVSLNVHSNNLPPVAIGSSYVMAQDTVLTVSAPGVLTGATDADGDVLTAGLVTGPAAGTVSLSADGSFQYTPTNGFVGNDSFTFEAFDGATNGNTATVNISVTNSQPMAATYTFYVHAGAILTVPPSGVLANDASPVGDPLVAQLASGPSFGAMALNPDGSFAYTNVSGSLDSFTYEAVDAYGTSTSAPALVTIIVTNRPPVAAADSYGVPTNSTLYVPAPGVLANDSDPDGDSLAAVLANQATNGSVTLNADGSFSYTPNTGYAGPDTFTYYDNDGLANGNTVAVSLNVHTTNGPPASTPSYYTIRPDETLMVTNDESVLDDDSDTDADVLTAVLLSPPVNGSLSFNPTNGNFVYVPNDGYVGPDSFTYQPYDGIVGGSPTPVYIYVQNSAPVANSDEYMFHFLTGTEDVTNYTVSAPGVLENDTDADQDELTADLVSGPAHGTVQLNEDGSFTYTPNPGFVGIDLFTYVADDGYTTSSVASVTIEMTDAAPVAQSDTFYIGKNNTLNTPAPGPLMNAYDDDADPLSAVPVSTTSNGALTLNADGSFTYTPNTGFVGMDSFSYSATDGGLTSAPVAINIEVTNNVVFAEQTALEPPAGAPSVTLAQLTFDNVFQTPTLPPGIGLPTGRAIYSDWAGLTYLNGPPKENGLTPTYFDGRAWAFHYRWAAGNGYIPSFNVPGLEWRYPYIYVRNNFLAASVKLSVANMPANSTINLTGDVYLNSEATKLFPRWTVVGLPTPSLFPAGALNGAPFTTLSFNVPVGAGPAGGAFNGLIEPRNGASGAWARAANRFPNLVGSNVMTIVWHYTVTPLGGIASADKGVCGVSKHIIYLTYGQTRLERDYWTVADAGCEFVPALAANLPFYSQNLHIAAIFQNEFPRLLGGPGNAKRVDGAPLSFYGTALQPSAAPPYWRSYSPNGWRAPQAGNAPDLLRYGAGWNRGWVQLFQYMLLAQGLTDANGVPVGSLTTVNANRNDNGFVLKGTLPAVGNGPFMAASAVPYVYNNYIYPTYQQGNNANFKPDGPRWRFVFKKNPPAGFSAPTVSTINGQNDAAGLVAPGFPTANFGGAPNWWFIDWVLRINNTLYDPTYGVSGTISDLQSKLVDGTFKFDNFNAGSSVFKMEKTTAAGNVGKIKIKFLNVSALAAGGNLTVTLRSAIDNNFNNGGGGNNGGAVDTANGTLVKLMYWKASTLTWIPMTPNTQTANGVANFANLLGRNPQAPAHGLIRATADGYGDGIISY